MFGRNKFSPEETQTHTLIRSITWQNVTIFLGVGQIKATEVL